MEPTPIFEKVSKMRGLSYQRKSSIRVVRNFTYWVTISFIFWTNLKNEDSRAKKRFLKGSKKAWFFFFWQNLEIMDSRAKRCFELRSRLGWVRLKVTRIWGTCSSTSPHILLTYSLFSFIQVRTRGEGQIDWSKLIKENSTCPFLKEKKKSKLIRPEVILLYIRYFLRYRLETSHGDPLLHFKHFSI